MTFGLPAFMVGVLSGALASQFFWRRYQRRQSTLQGASDIEISRLALVARKTDNTVILTDPSGCIEWVNDGFTRLTGYTMQEAKGKSPGSLVQGPDTNPATVRFMREQLKAGRDFTVEIINYSKAGARYWVQVSVQPLRDERGEITGIFSINSDITERKEAQQSARHSARQFQDLFEFAPDAIVITDSHDMVRMMNGRAETLFGYSRGELLTHPAGPLLGSGTGGPWPTLLAPSPEIVLPVVRKAMRKDGSRFPVDVSVGGIEVEGEVWRVSVIRDATEREGRLRAELRNQRLESIGNLAGGIAHDLNNALAPVMMGIELLKKQNPENAKLIDIMASSANHGADMVRQLLTFARGSAGERRLVKVRPLLEEMEKIIAATFPKSLNVHITCAEAISPIYGDSTQLHQVLLNLCVNARDAMPPDGTLVVSAENAFVATIDHAAWPQAHPGEYVIWRVRDSGTGIPPEIIERIFEPYFTTKGPDKGTGLGLSTVIGIVRSHGGFVTVESEVNRGTTFTVSWPSAATAASDSRPPISSPEHLRGEGRLVLVVDDEEAVREMMRAVLTDLDYEVITATDGSDAVTLLAGLSKPVHGVITDLHMREMNGFALIRTLRWMVPTARVIVSSGRLDKAEENELGVLKPHARLDKPFNQAALIAALRTLD